MKVPLPLVARLLVGEREAEELESSVRLRSPSLIRLKILKFSLRIPSLTPVTQS